MVKKKIANDANDVIDTMIHSLFSIMWQLTRMNRRTFGMIIIWASTQWLDKCVGEICKQKMQFYYCRFVITTLQIQLQPRFSTVSIELCTSTENVLSSLANPLVAYCDTYECGECLTGQMIRAIPTFMVWISENLPLPFSRFDVEWFPMRYTTQRTLLSNRIFMALFFVSLFMIIICFDACIAPTPSLLGHCQPSSHTNIGRIRQCRNKNNTIFINNKWRNVQALLIDLSALRRVWKKKTPTKLMIPSSPIFLHAPK